MTAERTSNGAASRWRPHRAGIFNVWEYDDQEFAFGDGRLVLRGRNGSGKSNALSLLFPFLLDGVMSASRMDPMGGARSMKSLLLGRSDESGSGRYRHDSGTGYVWMEFVRPDHEGGHGGGEVDHRDHPGGEARTLTVGIGASATAQRDADSWFFVTPQRIGVDLELHDDDVPKSRRRLVETMAGTVHATAQDYRAELDRHLFGLGDDRYRILVDLLLTLRRPHLAGKLDIDHLSATLTAGLAEIDAGLVDDVAHSFDDLDAMQHELDALRTALGAVERFLPIYRLHLTGVARRRAGSLTDADREVRRIRRERGEASSEREEASTASIATRAEVDRLEAERRSVGVQIETIQTSDSYRSIAALDEVERAADMARRTADRLDHIAGRAENLAAEAETAREAARRRARRDAERLTKMVHDWIGQVRALGVEWPTEPHPDEPFAADRATASLAARRSEVGIVLDAATAAEQATIEAELRRAAADDAEAEHAVAWAETAVAADDVAEVRTHLRDRRRAWAEATAATVREIDVAIEAAVDGTTASRTSRADSGDVSATPFSGTLLTDLATGGGPDHEPVTDVDVGDIDDDGPGGGRPSVRPDADVETDARIVDFVTAVEHRVERALDATARTRDDLRAIVEQGEEERERVATEPNPGPPPNPTRPDAAGDRRGVPLYACVEFTESVPESDRAGLEAALHAAGILDARILPDGSTTDALDAILVGLDASEPAGGTELDATIDAAAAVVDAADVAPSGAGPSGAGTVGRGTLGDLLVPVPHADLTGETIVAVLARVPIDAETARIEADGRWRLGPLAGRFLQESASYVGHEARERRRAARLAEIDARLDVERATLAALGHRINHLGEFRVAIVAACDDRPRVVELERALALVTERRTVERERAERLVTARLQSEGAAEVAASTSAELQRLAVAHRLSTVPAELHDARSGLDESAREVPNLVGEEGRRDESAALADEAARRADEARTDAVDRRRESTAAHGAAADATARHERLRRDVGEDAQRAHDELVDAKRRMAEAEQQLGESRTALRESELRVERLGERIEQLTGSLAGADQRRADADERFATVCTTEIVEVLDVAGVDEDTDRAVAARVVLDGTESVADDATNGMERAYREIIIDGLRAGNDPSMPKVDGIDVIRVATVEGEVGIGALAARLREDDERLGNLLSTKEREIFETHLLTNIGDEIRRLLLDADAFEHRINAEMSKAPTSSDMVVELAWNVADEPGLRDAVDLLRRSPDLLGPEQRDRLRSFLVRRIDDVRADDPGLSFAESLAAALDYRRWHRFDLFARFAGGRRQRITRTLFRGLSGGEQAVVLHLPLFAAASSQYSSGTVDGPRLIALDEAFVGIDDPMRGSLMGLLNQLDLDLLVTSHEFWGFYEQVPNLVVYDLIRNPAVPGVYAQRFDWTAGPG